MFFALVELLIEPADVDEYVAFRQQHINPDMYATGAFVGSHYLQSVQSPDADGKVRCLLLNSWRDLEVQRAFATQSSHVAQLAQVQHLIDITSVRYFRRLDVSYGLAERGPARFYVVARHRARPGRGADYAAAWADVRAKLDDLPACVGITVGQDIDDPESFTVQYRWNADNQAAQADQQAAVAQLLHDLVADGLGGAERYIEHSRG